METLEFLRLNQIDAYNHGMGDVDLAVKARDGSSSPFLTVARYREMATLGVCHNLEYQSP